MKTLSVLPILLVTLFLTISAGKGKTVAPPPPEPTITVSPAAYSAGDPISFSGSNFVPRETVTIHVAGPMSMDIATVTDHNGSFFVYFPGGILFFGGYYTVTGVQTTTTHVLTATSGLVVN